MDTTIEPTEAPAATPTRSNGDLNLAAIRRHALKVSKTNRAGKFTRVSEEFFNQRAAEKDATIRGLLRPDVLTIGVYDVAAVEGEFLTGEGKRKLCAAFNAWLGRKIQQAVNDSRVGKTL
jgi:hypothetical protein